MLLAAILAAAYFGLDFDPAATNVATESRIYPVSPVAYRMVQPDGTIRIFELTDAKEGTLSGPKPWLGVVKDRQIDIWADPQYTGGKLRTAFTFVAGRLRLMVLDGKKFTFAKMGPPKEDLAEMFPERKERSYEKNSSADIWRDGGTRLRLWFANPNSAGILLAELLLVLVWLAMATRGLARIGSGVLAVVAACGMLATGSRGALVGAAAGLFAIAAVHARRLFTKRGVLVLLIGLCVLVSGLIVSGNSRRVIDTFRSIDAGNMTRLKICKAAVQMFADAPFGWQGGEVPGRNACLNWYVFNEKRSLRTHVMSLAECGWPKGFLYVFFWALVLSAGAVLARKGRPLPLALWSSFCLAGCFNPVYIDWEDWVLPVASLGALAYSDGRLSAKQWRKAAIVAAILSLTVVAGLVIVGKSMRRSTAIPVKSCGKATFVNGSNPRVWIVGDPVVMAGNGFPGREILSYFKRNPDAEPIAYVYDVEDLPLESECVIVAGRNVPDYLAAYEKGRACKTGRLLMLSPSVGPGAVPERLAAETQLLWVAGSLLASHEPSYAEKRPWVKLAPGCERYVPDWMRFASMRTKHRRGL